jgi:site-specific DNA-methyltransferase (adenine-specific)
MTVQTELVSTQNLELGKIHQGDCIELMQRIESDTVDLVFADPPFNIGYEYDLYHDRQDHEEYIMWSTKWMDEVHRVLKSDGTFWLAIGDEYAAELKIAAQSIGFSTRSWVVWYYTFGVNCKMKFSRSHVHLFHFVKDENNFTFNAEDPSVRVPSARALVYADKRANPNGRLPDDTWILRPQDLPHGFDTMDDTWYFARVAGTFAERQGFHGCQMPEQLLGRIIRVSSNTDCVVLDPFAGSGTTLAVAKKLNRRWIGCELSVDYVRSATDRLKSLNATDSLDGPLDPIASAPSTANGRKLERQDSTPPASLDPASSHVNFSVRVPLEGVEIQPTPKDTKRTSAKTTAHDAIREAIVDAFFTTHGGYSTDWLLADPLLQNAFHDECRSHRLIGNPVDWNRELLRLRKAGHLPKSQNLKHIHFSAEEMDSYQFASEISWRMASERFGGISLDEIFCDPTKAQWFDKTAHRFSPGFDATKYRWAALRLRKASKQLVSEAKQFQFIYANRDFARRSEKLSSIRFDRYSGQPGLYLLQDDEKRRLFVDRAQNLGTRLAHHAACEAITKKTTYVSLVQNDQLPGAEYHDLFKVDLVRRYSPELKMNVNLVGLISSVAI